MKAQTKLLVGGAVALAVGVIGGVAYARNKASSAVPAGSPPAGAALPAVNFITGTKYVVAAILPTTVTTKQQALDALTSVGWTNVVIIYFPAVGGAASSGTWPDQAKTALGIDQPLPNMYAFDGLYTGSGAAVQPGVLAVSTA